MFHEPASDTVGRAVVGSADRKLIRDEDVSRWRPASLGKMAERDIRGTGRASLALRRGGVGLTVGRTGSEVLARAEFLLPPAVDAASAASFGLGPWLTVSPSPP